MANSFGDTHHSASIRARALKGVALSAVALAMAAPGFAQAQQESGDVQEVTITGSRIKAPNLTSDSPVTAVGAEEIKQQGTTNIETLLNNLPAVSADIGNAGYGAGGAANVNLRALGSVRTLVLIDGQRVGPTSPTNSATDLNLIPAALVKSIEVLTGGASAVYGSDAMAGVVNFHLLNNFEGVMFDETFSGYAHNNNNSAVDAVLNNGVGGTNANPTTPVDYRKGAQWDGFVRDTTAVMGVNAPNNKGNVMMWAEYRATTPVVGPQRDTSACLLSLTSAAPGKSCGGSSTGVYGKFSATASVLTANGIPAQYATLSDNPNGTRTFIHETTAQAFNFASTAYEQSQDDRTSIGANGHYELASWATLYSNLMFLHDSNLGQIGPDPIAGSASATPPFIDLVVNCSTLGSTPSTDPVLKGLSQQQLLGCNGPTGHGALQATTSTQVPALRLLVPRQAQIDTYRYRAVAGVKGDINTAWSYDVSANYFRSNLTAQSINFPTIANYSAAMAAGTLDPFQFDPAVQVPQESALGALGINTGYTNDYDVVASASGDLGEYGVISPWAKNSVMAVLGVEYRRSEVKLSPDGLISGGQLLGGTAVEGFSGAEANREVFSEIRAPLIEDMPWIKSLDLNMSFRHTETDVENTGNSFSANTWKIAADYAPDNQIRFRGGFNRADRAPNTFELFNPIQFAGGLGGGSDPCAAGAVNALPMAACTNPALPAGARVPASLYTNGQSGVTNCTSDQCNLNTGGNTALKPEKGETWTWGANLTPDFLPGFNASVDYWDIKIDNFISTIPAASILSGCYTGQPGYCSYIHRDPNNGYSLDNTTLGSVDNFNQNVDSLHTTGIDFDIGYHKNLDDLGFAPGLGAVSLSLLGTYELTNKTQVLDSLKTYDCAGYFGTNCIVPSPHWRHTFRATYTAPWGQDMTLSWRYIGGTLLDANSPNMPNYTAGVYDAADAKIPAYSYFDLSTSYQLWDKYTLRVGVNNLFDKDPPLLATNDPILATGGVTMNAFTTYDTLGRQIFMNFNAKF